jgi:hypothetical protein
MTFAMRWIASLETQTDLHEQAPDALHDAYATVNGLITPRDSDAVGDCGHLAPDPLQVGYIGEGRSLVSDAFLDISELEHHEDPSRRLVVYGNGKDKWSLYKKKDVGSSP